MSWTRKSNQVSNRHWGAQHRSEHWYRDNQVYFITARCQGRFPAFDREKAKQIFWSRFDLAAARYGFKPWVTSLLDNHYHTIGWLSHGEGLAPMMKLLHGGVAKLVNDLLEARVRSGEIDLPCDGVRLVPFWRDARYRNYFDGCLRSERQGRLTYRYVLTQAARHGVVDDWREYPHTRVDVELDDAITFAIEHGAFLEGVPYRRYER